MTLYLLVQPPRCSCAVFVQSTNRILDILARARDFVSRRLGKLLTWERKRCRDQRTSQGRLGRRRARVGQGSSAAVGGADEINANQPGAISPRHIQSRTGALRDPESSGFCGYFAQFSGFSALQGWTRRSSLASNQAAQATSSTAAPCPLSRTHRRPHLPPRESSARALPRHLCVLCMCVCVYL